MSAGTRLILAMAMLFVLVLVGYWGLIAPGDDALERSTSTVAPLDVAGPGIGTLSEAVETARAAAEAAAADEVVMARPAPLEVDQPILARPEPTAPVVDPAPDPQPIADPATPAPRTHVVVSGDTLSSLAEEYLGDMNRWLEFYDMNRAVIGTNPDALRVGMKLVIPAK